MPSLMATSCAGVHTPLGPKCILCLKAMFLYIKGNHQKKKSQTSDFGRTGGRGVRPERPTVRTWVIGYTIKPDIRSKSYKVSEV